jgi:membrane protein required for colicin V production
MLIDILVFMLLLLALFKGMRKGFIVAVFSFIASIIGLAAALKLSAIAASYIGSTVNISQRWLPVLAFMAVFFIVVLLVRLGAKALEGVVRFAMLGWLNKIGGFIFYALLYIFIFSIILFYATRVGIIKQETIKASQTYGYIQPLGPKVIAGLGAVIPLFQNMFGELEHFFDNVSKNAAK